MIDFTQSDRITPGMVTAYFMNMFQNLLECREVSLGSYWHWFVQILNWVRPSGRKWLTSDGVIHDVTELSLVAPVP
jgi:hypothetical protein